MPNTHGGNRAGAGRRTSEDTKMMRVPVGAIPDIRDYLHKRKQPQIKIAPLQSIQTMADYARIDLANTASIPLVGSTIAAGFPSPADDFIEEYLDLHQLLVNDAAATFIVRVKKESESMIEAGIHPGDLLVVDRSLTPANKDIVIAVVDGEFTVKELCIKKGLVSLIPRNSRMKPITFREGQELLVWGVVTSFIHQFRR